MVTDRLRGTLEDVLVETFSPASSRTYVVNPTRGTLEALVEVAPRVDLPPLRVLVDPQTVRRVTEDFLVAGRAADLVEAGTVEFRTVDNYDENAVVATGDRLVAPVSVGTRAGGLVTEDEDFLATARETYGDTWELADRYNLRTPGLSRVRETLGERLGTETREDFSNVLDSLETARGDGDGLDEVTISLLVAGKNEQLFYDVSKWGEDVGVASKATFSRVKNDLEDAGLLDTEKVHVDVGRPRQRLVLGQERLRDADAAQLTSVAETLLH